MHFTRYTIIAIIQAASLVLAESPQENSHAIINSLVRKVLEKAPSPKADPVQGLLNDQGASGNIQASGLSSKVTPECLQQELADLCLTTAKQNSMGKDAQAVCIMYRALERNTDILGLKSALCKTPPSNKELSNLSQHQDPASAGAQDWNAGVEKEVALQMVALGFSADQAVDLSFRTATFAAGTDKSDTNARANSCDSIPSFTRFGEAVAVPEVYATKDGKKDSAPVSGTVYGQTFKGGELIDCGTLALVTNDHKYSLVPAISREELLKALPASTSSGAAAPAASFASASVASTSSTVAPAALGPVTVVVGASSAAATSSSTTASASTTADPAANDPFITKTAALFEPSSSSSSSAASPSAISLAVNSAGAVTITVTQTATATITACPSSGSSTSVASTSTTTAAPAANDPFSLFRNTFHI